MKEIKLFTIAKRKMFMMILDRNTEIIKLKIELNKYKAKEKELREYIENDYYEAGGEEKFYAKEDIFMQGILDILDKE